jgi:hypothetical protein
LMQTIIKAPQLSAASKGSTKQPKQARNEFARLMSLRTSSTICLRFI